MIRTPTLVCVLISILTCGCAAKLNEWGVLGDNLVQPVGNLLPTGLQREGSAVEQASFQMKEDFFICRGVDGKGWGEPQFDFTIDDPKLVAVAQLDKRRDTGFIIVEIVSPWGRIVARERRDWTPGEYIGFSFNPEKLLTEGSSGDWRALFWFDGEPVGYADFSLIGDDETELDELAGYETMDDIPAEEMLSLEDIASETEEETFLVEPAEDN